MKRSKILSIIGQQAWQDQKPNGREEAPSTKNLRSFIQDTTLHGVRFLCYGNFFRRLIWTVALGSCLGFCVYQIVQALTAYYIRPFITRITTKGANINRNLTFPAVTLCNFNFFNRRRYINLTKTKNMLDNDVIALNFKAFEAMLAKSTDVFNTKNKEHPYLFDRKGCEDGSYNCYLTLFSHRIDEMLLPSPTFQSCEINGFLATQETFHPLSILCLASAILSTLEIMTFL